MKLCFFQLGKNVESRGQRLQEIIHQRQVGYESANSGLSYGEKKRGQTFTLQDKKEVSFPLSFSFTLVKKNDYPKRN